MSSPGAYLLGPTYAAHDIGAHWEPIREAARRRTLGNKENYPLFVKMMDLYVGIPDSYIFSSPAMFRRRRYYGGAGEFRYKTYPGGTIGIEYRTPSPMMYVSQGMVGMMFGAARYLEANFQTLKASWDRLRSMKLRVGAVIREHYRTPAASRPAACTHRCPVHCPGAR